MSEDKHVENDPERTLMTLEQLSQTIEVMTSVVNRLRQHLSDQLKTQAGESKNISLDSPAAESQVSKQTQTDTNRPKPAQQKRESFVVEINQQGAHAARKNTKVLH